MAARQRLKVVLEARRASQRCWRCTLDLPRYHSTRSAIRQDWSRSTDTVAYDQVLQQEIEKTLKAFFGNTLEAAPRTSHESQSGMTYTTEEPFKGRVEDGGHVSVISGSESQPTEISQQSRQQIILSDQPVTQETSLQTRFSLGKKLRIRRLDVHRPTGRMSTTIRKTYGKKGGFTLVPPNINGNSTKDEHGSQPVNETPRNSECQPNIRGSEGLIAENSGASVKLTEGFLIKKHPCYCSWIKKWVYDNGALKIPKIPESVQILSFIRKLQHYILRHYIPRTKELGFSTDANEVPLDVQREAEASYDALVSLLDSYRDFPPPRDFSRPKISAASERTKKSGSSARFSPQASLIRRSAITTFGSHALDRQSLDSSKRLYSTGSTPQRHNATATVSKED